jgi:hypothetical protein
MWHNIVDKGNLNFGRYAAIRCNFPPDIFDFDQTSLGSVEMIFARRAGGIVGKPVMSAVCASAARRALMSVGVMLTNTRGRFQLGCPKTSSAAGSPRCSSGSRLPCRLRYGAF